MNSLLNRHRLSVFLILGSSCGALVFSKNRPLDSETILRRRLMQQVLPDAITAPISDDYEIEGELGQYVQVSPRC